MYCMKHNYVRIIKVKNYFGIILLFSLIKTERWPTVEKHKSQYIFTIHKKLFRYVQKNRKKWSTLCIYECVGLVWYVWQCGFAPVWLNLAQCVHKFHIQCAYAETGWILLKWRCWRCCLKRSDSEPTAFCLSNPPSLSTLTPLCSQRGLTGWAGR